MESCGEKLFPGLTGARALQVLRVILHGLGVQEHMSYRTHDLRRGHARDLQLSGTAHLSACLL